MKKVTMVLLVAALSTGAAFAQAATDTGVSVSTDPAKAAAVEKHAQELQAAQGAQNANSTMAKEPTAAGKKTSSTKHHAKAHRHHAKKSAAKDTTATK